jgi:hypothetical protein
VTINLQRDELGVFAHRGASSSRNAEELLCQDRPSDLMSLKPEPFTVQLSPYVVKRFAAP